MRVKARWILTLLALTGGVSLLVVSGPAGAEDTDTAAISRGRSTFVNYCGSCHGKQGEGDGPVAEYLEPKPSDLTQITFRYRGAFPTETLHKIIDGREMRPAHGSPDMPAWGNAFKVALEEDDEEKIARKIDDLVAYLRTIQLKAPTE